MGIKETQLPAFILVLQFLQAFKSLKIAISIRDCWPHSTPPCPERQFQSSVGLLRLVGNATGKPGSTNVRGGGRGLGGGGGPPPSRPAPWFCFRGGRVRHVIFEHPVPAGQWMVGSKMAATASIRERQTGTRSFLLCCLCLSKAATCLSVAFAGCSRASELIFLSCSTLRV